MKRHIEIFFISFLFTGILFTGNSCTKRNIILKPTTERVSAITQTGAVVVGNLSEKIFGHIIDKGIYWENVSDPAENGIISSGASGKGSYVCTLTGLKPGGGYYVKSYVISGTDTLYGDNILFYTQDYGTMRDIDGNIYKTINIGTRTWMAENLKTTRYNDGKTIPLVQDEKAWVDLSTPGYCWYGNDGETYREDYGALYNWHAINTGILCPEGWHVPTDEEWRELTMLLDGENKAGGKLKQTGIACWVEPNTGATNEYGFNALPGGFRFSDGKFYDFGFSGYWWSSTEKSNPDAYFRFVYYIDSNIYRFNNDKTNGFSIRCIKDK